LWDFRGESVGDVGTEYGDGECDSDR
jgi:hypothetical protein